MLHFIIKCNIFKRIMNEKIWNEKRKLGIKIYKTGSLL